MKTALIIEDSEGVVSAIQTVLSGMESKAAHTMTEAIAMLSDSSFDIVFLDLHLPDSECQRTLEMVPLIRRISHDAALVLMTGHASAIGNAKLAVDSVLYKPFTSDNIRDALSNAQLSQARNACKVGDTEKMCMALLALT